MMLLAIMFENSQDSVVFKTLGQPLIPNSQELLRAYHFDSELEGLLRSTTFKAKHAKQVEEAVRAKMASRVGRCLQILSYSLREQGGSAHLRLWLHPAVRATLFDRLKRQIEGEFHCQEGLLRSYARQLVEVVSDLQQHNQYRDINFWNVFEDGNENILIGELSEVASQTPVSRLYGCFLDYISPPRKAFKPIHEPKEMAWGLGIILMGLAINQLPKCLNWRDKETKLRIGFMLEAVKARHGWDLYEIVKGLLEGRTCP